MASAGNLVVTLTADQSSFVAGMKDAEKHLDKFGNTMPKVNKHQKEFSAHMLTNRRALSTFSGVMGTTVGPLSHLVHAFEMAPGPIGLMLGAILLVREAFAGQAEAAEKAQKANDAYYTSLKKQRLEVAGVQESPLQKAQAESGERVKKLRDEKLQIIDETRDGWSAVWEASKNYLTGGSSGQAKVARLTDIQTQLRLEKHQNSFVVANAGLEASKAESKTTEAASIGSALGVLQQEHSIGEQQVNLLEKIAGLLEAKSTSNFPTPQGN